MAHVAREQAQEFSETLDQIGAAWYRQAVLAGQMGVPDALGLTWTAWCDKYMPKLRMAMRDRQRVVAELAEQEVGGQKLSNRQIAAILGVSTETVNRDVRKLTATNVALPRKNPPSQRPIDGVPATFVAPPDSSARAERITRDNRAEQKRAARAEREARVPDVPEPDIRTGTLSVALKDVRDVDLVFTDPPYSAQFLPAWSELAEWAKSALKPGRLLVAYSGQSRLPEVMERLSRFLTYQWLGWVLTPGPNVSVRQKPVMSGGKPLLFFSNGKLDPVYDQRRFIDVATADRRTRELHTWQQDEAPVAWYVETLAERGELVADPFLGSGTTAVVCKELERRFVGCDIDASAVATAAARLSI